MRFPHYHGMIPDDLKLRPTDWLVQFALTCSDLDDERRWQAVTILQDRGDREVFDAAVALCANSESRYRELGVDLLGQNVASTKTFHDDSVVAMLRLLKHETDPRVLHSLGMALGHRRDPRCIGPLAALQAHPDENVRYGVVYGMLAHDDPRAVNALIELSADTDTDVRDWATFGLGSQIDTDTPEIREALARRLDDPNEDTREEAMIGLATRQDARALPSLVAVITDGWCGMLMRETVDAFPHPDVVAAIALVCDQMGAEERAWADKLLTRSQTRPSD